jgi:hypothetical protein
LCRYGRADLRNRRNVLIQRVGWVERSETLASSATCERGIPRRDLAGSLACDLDTAGARGGFRPAWRLIKTVFSRGLPGGERISASHAGKASAGSGNGGIGRIRCVTKTISAGIWIIPLQSGETRVYAASARLALFLRFAAGSDWCLRLGRR